MSDLTPYEKKLAHELKQLPLPNEDAAWNDMSKLLDENHDKGGVPPNRGTIILGSIAGALLIGALLFFICKKSIDNKQQVTISNGTKDNQVTTHNTNSTLNNKDAAIADKSVTTTNSHNPIGGQVDSQNKSIIYNSENKLNSIGQTTNNSKAANTYSNNKEQSTSITTNTRSTNTITIEKRNNSKQSINSKETNNPAPFIADDARAKNTSDKNLRGLHHINNLSIKKAPDKNIDKADETIATDDAVTNNKTRKNKNGISGNVSLNSVTVAVKHTTHHYPTARSTTKTLAQNNDVVSNSNASGNNNVTVDQPGNTALPTKAASRNHNNRIASNNNSSANNTITTTNDFAANTTKKANSKNIQHLHSTPAYYGESIVAVTTKNSKRNSKKKNSIRNTTAKTYITISGSDVEESDNIVDTAQLIKIGQNVLAKKKARRPAIKDTSAAKPLVAASKAADIKKKKDKKQLDISVGLGEQQAIRLNCDCVYPNDAYTKSSLVTDYIPSIYVKIQPSKKWFIQAEVKYKAPQYIQEQLYQKNVSNQPLNYVTSTSVLKKVYYNQIPVSFNYVIIPNLSLGIGVIYNNFAGKVSQQDVTKKLYGSAGDSTLSSSISSNKNDSTLVFTKNSFQGLIEAQYKWNRFTFGARYAVGLQPYLKYNAPTGNPVEKKNDALIVFIHFELWDSKSKKKK